MIKFDRKKFDIKKKKNAFRVKNLFKTKMIVRYHSIIYTNFIKMNISLNLGQHVTICN